MNIRVRVELGLRAEGKSTLTVEFEGSGQRPGRERGTYRPTKLRGRLRKDIIAIQSSRSSTTTQFTMHQEILASLLGFRAYPFGAMIRSIQGML
jgi:hypothetical protein